MSCRKAECGSEVLAGLLRSAKTPVFPDIHRAGEREEGNHNDVRLIETTGIPRLHQPIESNVAP